MQFLKIGVKSLYITLAFLEIGAQNPRRNCRFCTFCLTAIAGAKQRKQLSIYLNWLFIFKFAFFVQGSVRNYELIEICVFLPFDLNLVEKKRRATLNLH